MTSIQSCSRCHKTNGKIICTGCDNYYCTKCFRTHRRTVDEELGDLVNERDLIQGVLNQSFKSKRNFNTFKRTIDEWENKMLINVNRTAENARKKLEMTLNEMENDISSKFNKVSRTLIEFRDNEDFVERDLVRIRNELKSFSKDLNDLETRHEVITIKDTSDRINWQTLIHIHSKYDKPIGIPQIPSNATWSQNATTIITGLSGPWGLAVDQDDGTVYVADRADKKIISWNPITNITNVILSNLFGPTDVLVEKETNSIIIADYDSRRVLRCSLENGKNQVETIIDNIGCWGLAIDNEGSLYVCDCDMHEVRKFPIGDRTGILVAGGNRQGNANHQLNFPRYIALDNEGSLYVTDRDNHRVMKWKKEAKEGINVAGINGRGSNNDQLVYPNGILVDSNGNIYVPDWNNRITRWLKGEKTGEIVVGGNRSGNEMNQLNFPIGLSFDRKNNLYVVDYNNNRVQRFSIQ